MEWWGVVIPTVASQSVLCSNSTVFPFLFFKSRDLHKEETMVSEAHCMSFPCTELLLVKTVFHSMAPFKLILLISENCLTSTFMAINLSVHKIKSLLTSSADLTRKGVAFLLLRIPLAAEVEGAALAVGHLTANLLVSDWTFGEILHSLVKKKKQR